MEIDRTLSKPFLTTRQVVPDNQETPIHFLRQWITPVEYFYRRNHFPYPVLSRDAFRIPIEGEVKKPFVLCYESLIKMPSKTIVFPLECSGNKRAYFEPRVYGEQWKDGAISQGVWKGVSLSYILSITGIKGSAKEVVFEAYDCGERKDMEGIFPFARSLSLEKALHPDTLIACELNGKAIPYKNGYPMRLVVPQWYGMASVKWLKKITVIDRHFTGPFQDIDYNYYPDKLSDKGKTPVTTIKVNSTILQPLDGAILKSGTYKIEGIAWTGKGNIAEVQVSRDGGTSWEKTVLYQNRSHPYAWTFWTFTWEGTKGEHTIMSRARNTFGRIQPYKAVWNRLGYGYNSVAAINVKVE